MRTAEEILKEAGLPVSRIHSDKGTFSTIDAMKSYAIEVLREAAQRAKVQAYFMNGTDSYPAERFNCSDVEFVDHVKVDKESILSLIEEIKP